MAARRTRTYKLFRDSKQKTLHVSTALVLAVSGLGGVVPALLGQTAFATSPTNEYVSTSGHDSGNCGSSKSACATISYALGQADNGTTIHVAAGTYNEQLSINKTVGIVGAGSSSTIITVPTSVTGGGKIVDVNAPDVTLKDLSVSGPFQATSCNDNEYGVYFENGASGTITDSSIVNIEDANSALLGCQQGVAVRVGQLSAGISANAVLKGDTISGYQKGGIVVDGTGSTATLDSDMVTGAGPVGYTAQNGIQVSRGATATVSNDTVTGNSYTLTADNGATAAGILLYGAGDNTVVKNDTVTGNQIGYYTETKANLANLNLKGISNNTRNAVAWTQPDYSPNPWATPTTVYVDPSLAGTAQADSVYGSDIVSVNGGLHVWDYDVFATFQAASSAVAANGTIEVPNPNGGNGFVAYHVPTAPTNGSPNAKTIKTNNFYFKWNASKGVGSLTYEYQASMNPAENNGVLTTSVWDNIVDGNAQQKNLTSPEIISVGAPNGTWYWQVRAIDAYGNMSAWSPIWSVTLNVK